MGAQTAADLEDALSTKPLEGDPFCERPAVGGGAAIEGRGRKKAAIDLLVELVGACGGENGFVPIVAHGIGVPPTTVLRLDFSRWGVRRHLGPTRHPSLPKTFCE